MRGYFGAQPYHKFFVAEFAPPRASAVRRAPRDRARFTWRSRACIARHAFERCKCDGGRRHNVPRNVTYIVGSYRPRDNASVLDQRVAYVAWAMHGIRCGAVAVTTKDATMDAQALAVLNHPATSKWLREALRSAMDRDPVDATNDAEYLAQLLRERCDAIQTRWATRTVIR